MTEKEQIDIFRKNLLMYIHESGKTQTQVAADIGVSVQTLNNWCTGFAFPRMGKVQALADYFHINKSDLIEENYVNHTESAEDMTKAMDLYMQFAQLPPDRKDALIKYLKFLQSQP